MKARAHVFITGAVQGVFFRSETKQQAVKHGVTGWIRNLPDGRVEGLFEGKEESVRELVEFCKHGPEGARVEKISVDWEPYAGGFNSFRIVYAPP